MRKRWHDKVFPSRNQSRSPSRRLLVLLLTALTISGCQPHQEPAATKATSPLLPQVHDAFKQKQYERVIELGVQVDDADDGWESVQELLAEAYYHRQQYDAAMAVWTNLIEKSDAPAVRASAHFFLGEINREQGRLGDAISAFRHVLQNEPDNIASHERLAFLLGATGQMWESAPHFFVLVKSGTATYHELALFSDLGRASEQQSFLLDCQRSAPHDPFVQLGLAANEYWAGNHDSAREMLADFVEQHPDVLAAQAMLGELLVEGPEDEFLGWHDRLSGETDHPNLWYVRGLWARRQDDLPAAAGCFLQTLQLAPTHRRACYQLGQVLAALDEDHAEAVRIQALKMAELTQAVDNILRSDSQDERAMKQAANHLASLGRLWESCAWAVLGQEQFPDSAWHQDIFHRYAHQLTDDLPQVIAARQIARRFDRNPFPTWGISNVQTQGANDVSRPGSKSRIRFEIATQLPHQVYENADDPSTAGVRMFESNGGGVGVLDFDVDGRCDLYLTQGAKWEHGAAEPTRSRDLTDRLWRSQGRGFQDCTSSSFVAPDEEFSQGCAVGDINNDGFPDLYVANYGPNQIYVNNGDGTFSKLSDASSDSGSGWSSSCLIADLDGDQFPDLYSVNYLEGEELHAIICDGNACSPKSFQGAQDQVWLNRRDGTFEFVPNVAPATQGKGLGIVAANLFGDGRLSMFIANDQVANFLLRNETTSPGELKLREEAFLTGLGFNVDGLPMACMGIAADDVDNNGLLDFFVTNFKDEANTLYVQDLPGYFVDATTAWGLFRPSYDFVGWGTQFLDADRDGHVDLVLTNGHVDDYRDEGGEYHMRPQFFRNTGHGQFEELPPEAVGSYFAEKYLGRGLAKLDWNRDGLVDFAVSNIRQPAMLLTNRTEHPGHYLNVRLTGTISSRDAIGAIVTIHTSSGTRRKWLTAGDGFQASNERIVQFGLGDQTKVESAMIEWPSGRVMKLTNVPVDGTLHLFESLPYSTFCRDGICTSGQVLVSP